MGRIRTADLRLGPGSRAPVEDANVAAAVKCLGGHLMTMKSLLLGAAAGIAAIGAAQAADLPMTKGEAVEYVKVCSAFGPGFFYIPGSDTCLQIAGEIRADYRAFGHSGDFGDFNRND